MPDVYVVIVKHNMVTAVRPAAENMSVSVPQTKLEVGTRLAENYRVNGCIDGEYHFENAQRAKIFATLCLEFTRALADKRLDAIKALAVGAEYSAVDNGQE
jgi:hypothetical protein